MGVRGLFSFFENNHDNFFVQKEIRNTVIVVDGNNLRYHLFNTCARKNCYYGGDYEKYFRHVCKFFVELLACGIKPIIVMDGSYDVAKRKTLWQRTRDQIQAGIHCAPTNSLVVLPLMAKEVFLQAIKSFESIKLIQDFYEADSKIALIASTLNCPVLSNDSDFFVFNVDVISIRNMSFEHCEKENGNVLSCQKFDREAFLKHFGIKNRDMIFLLASLMGNDYVSGNVFERVFSQIKIPKKKSQSPRHRKMNGLLYWLSREKDITSAIDRLMNSIPMKDRKIVQSKLEAAIDMYKLESVPIEENSCENKHNLSDNIDILLKDQDLSNSLCTKFLNGYNNCSLPSWLLDVILHEQIYLPCQVEDKEHPSSHFFAEDILRTICEITLKFKKDPPTDDEYSIKLIGRDRNKCMMQVLKCYPNRSKYSNHEEMESTSRLQLLLDTLKVLECQYNVIINCDSKMKLLLICVHFWCSNQKNNVIAPNQTELGAIMALIAICDSQLMLKDNLSNEKADKIKQLFVPNNDLKSNKKMFDIAIVQVFANLQATVMYTIIVNRLLNFPMEEPKIHEIWNSTFLYNVASRFSTISEIQKHLDLAEFDEYLKICADLIPNFVNLKNKVVPKKRKKVRKRRQESENVECDIDNCIEEESNINIEYQDICNKFSILST